MAEADAANSAEPSASTSKKAGKGKGGGAGKKAARVKPSHPKTADMVTAAIKNLKERGGSSLQAIKKYIGSNYKVDAEKLAPFIRKYLKSAVTSGILVQTKGKGASGSFKLPTSGDKPAEKKKPSKPAPAKSAEPKTKKPKPTPMKKIPAVKKSASSAPVRAPVKSKPKPAPVKAKKAKKPPAKKPKPAKVKKPIAPKAKSPKKSPASKKK